MSIQSIVMKVMFKHSDDERDSKIPMPVGVMCRNDISYGPYGRNNLLDVYFPENTKGHLPTIVDVHGGGYVYGSKELYRRYCMDLARRGFTVINFNYRLAPKHKFPSPLEDLNAVMTWITENADAYPVDVNRLLLAGDSAGAQLASQYAAIYSNAAYASLFSFKVPDICIRGAALNCGMYDLTREDGDKRKGILLDYLGRKVAHDDPRLNVIGAITADFPPAYIATSANDFLRDRAEPFFNLLLKKGVPAQYKCYGTSEQKEVAHVFHLNIIHPEAVKCNDEECAFLKQYCGG